MSLLNAYMRAAVARWIDVCLRPSMRRHSLFRLGSLGGFRAIITRALGCKPPSQRLDPMRSVSVSACPPMTEPRLQFQSAFWLNLHNFLVKEAKRRERIDDDGKGARGNIQADTAGLRPLTPAERKAWDRAL